MQGYGLKAEQTSRKLCLMLCLYAFMSNEGRKVRAWNCIERLFIDYDIVEQDKTLCYSVDVRLKERCWV